MIVISRKQNQGIVIRDEIVVTVVEIGDDEVQLAIEGPNEMSIEPGEHYATVQEEAYLPAYAR
jgi:carbon storage regulator